MDCSTPGFPAHQTPRINSNSWPSSLWCHPTISSSVVISSSSLQSFQASRSFLMSQFHASGGQRLEFQLQHQSFQWPVRTDFLSDWLVGAVCTPRDSQESSPTRQFKSINSLVLSFLYSPALTSKEATELQKNIYFCFIDYAKAFDCVEHNKLWKILQEMGTPDHLTCLLRNLYAENRTWNNRLVPNRKRSTPRLYIVTLLI